MKTQIINRLKETKREGIDNVISWLTESDFFTAPASTGYHGAEEGGLAKHSVEVMQTIELLNAKTEEYTKETIALVGLLHDVCKVNTYTPNILKSKKVSQTKPYIRKDSFPIGHGEKSVIILLNLGLKLTEEEMLAIRYHMNAFDNTGQRDRNNWNKLSKLCFIADYYTSTFRDSNFKN